MSQFAARLKRTVPRRALLRVSPRKPKTASRAVFSFSSRMALQWSRPAPSLVHFDCSPTAETASARGDLERQHAPLYIVARFAGSKSLQGAVSVATATVATWHQRTRTPGDSVPEPRLSVAKATCTTRPKRVVQVVPCLRRREAPVHVGRRTCTDQQFVQTGLSRRDSSVQLTCTDSLRQLRAVVGGIVLPKSSCPFA